MSTVIQIDAPYLSIAEYAKRTGQTADAVASQCERGHLPFRKFTEKGKRGKRYINMVALYKQADNQH